MKSLVITILLFVIADAVFSQVITPNNNYSRRDEYLQKSRRKQKAGIAFLSVGGGLAVGGTALIIDGINRNKRSGSGNAELSSGEVEAVIGVFVTAIGVGFMCGSIPFFVGAHRSRARALSLAVKTENAPAYRQSSYYKQLYPALALQIPLGR